MFNTKIKLNHFLNESWRKTSNSLIYYRNYNYWRFYHKLFNSSFRCSFLCHWNNYRVLFWLRSSFNITYFKNREKTSRFFSDYAVHSIKIAGIIKKGYGNQEIFGSINGFEIKSPKEPKIKNIGKAKIHLEKDYPEIWTLKNKIKEISKSRLTLINTIINQNFRTRIQQILLNHQGVTFYNEIFDEVFKEIQNNMNGEHRTPLFRQSSNNLFFQAYFEPDQHIPLIHTDFNFDRSNEIIDDFNAIINSLITDNELINLVAEYNKERDDFYNNRERNNFFNQINKLYNNIVYENQSMPKKGKCGSKKCVTRLTKLRYLFPS